MQGFIILSVCLSGKFQTQHNFISFNRSVGPWHKAPVNKASHRHKCRNTKNTIEYNLFMNIYYISTDRVTTRHWTTLQSVLCCLSRSTSTSSGGCSIFFRNPSVHRKVFWSVTMSVANQSSRRSLERR